MKALLLGGLTLKSPPIGHRIATSSPASTSLGHTLESRKGPNKTSNLGSQQGGQNELDVVVALDLGETSVGKTLYLGTFPPLGVG